MEKIHLIDLYKQKYPVDYTKLPCMCGHIRRKVTSNVKDVTCKLCIKERLKYYKKLGW